jgi:hypothetical protein
MKTIDWVTYLVHNNPDGANDVLQSFGYERQDTIEDLEDGVRMIQLKEGEKATLELLKVHPDRNILSGINGINSVFRNATGEQDIVNENLKTPIIQPNQNPYNQAQPIIITSVGTDFGSLLQNTILLIVAFVLIKEIISK